MFKEGSKDVPPYEITNDKERFNMKLKRPAILMIVSSTVLLFVCILFFTSILPILNLLNNEITDSNGRPGITINEGDLIDKGSLPQTSNGANNSSADFKTANSIRSELAPNSQNILLLGVDQAAGLCDTICIANIDKANKTIKLIMIPRDTYVPYGKEIVNKLKEKGLANSKGIYKLNATSMIGKMIGYSSNGKFKSSGINFLHDILKSFYGVEFDDYIYMNFDGFIKIIDTMGGVDITVEQDIRNANGEMVIEKGVQHLEGDKALYYARHRYLYDKYGNSIPTRGDYYRKENQLKMMIEMSKQMVTLENVPRVGDIMYQLRSSVYHSIDSTDLEKYKDVGIGFAKSQYQTKTVLITGDDIDPMKDGVSYVLIK